MGQYTFTFSTELGGVLRPWVFGGDMPGVGALNQAAMGKAYKTALGNPELPPPEAMNTGVNDWYGRAVFSDLILRRDESDKDRIELINALITVNRKKNIVQTSLSGRVGSVIEYISMPGYDITINGLLIGDEYPKKQTEALIRILNETVTLEAVSDYLAMFSIYNVVVTKFKIVQEAAQQSSQKINITLISDEMLELVIE